jgi:hypothetical protein
MQSKSIRIAYLKRMLKRLEGEDRRIQDLASAGELTLAEAELAVEQLSRSRNQLLTELSSLRLGDPAK